MQTVNFSHFDSVISIFKHFSTQKTCISFLEKQRWADGVVCQYCGSKCVCHRSNGRWQCNYSHKSFSALLGTIFENTKVKLVKWFVAMYIESAIHEVEALKQKRLFLVW